MHLGISLKMALAKKPMRNRTFAELMETSESNVSRWISTGSIKRGKLERICEILDIKVSEFIALGED